MAIQTIYYSALVGHIVGLTLMAGTTVSDYIVFRQFWKQVPIDRSKGIVIQRAVSRFPLLFGIGFIFLVISGVTMMAITHGVFGEQIWFRIKFALIIIIIINGLAFGRRQGVKLKRYLSEELPGINGEQNLLRIKRNLGLFHLLQIALFILIYVLSVFKFN